jgi:CRISPR-associated endonuclease/helicase Cas3
VQRFGRVNRRPEPGSARIEVIPARFDRKKDKDAEDEITDDQLDRLKKPFQSEHWPRDPNDTQDASPLAISQLKEKSLASPQLAQDLKKAETDEPLRPALTRALVEGWGMTSLDKHPGRPDIEPWLRGWIEREPQTTVMWRSRFPLRGTREGRLADSEEMRLRDVKEFFEVAPPHPTELLEAPTWRVVEVIRKRAEAWKPPIESELGPWYPPIVVTVNRRNEVEDIFPRQRVTDTKKDALERLWAGRILVVDARLGGLDGSGLLDAKGSDAPTTIDGDGWDMQRETWGRRVCWGDRASQSDSGWRRERYRWREDPDDDDSHELWIEVWRGRKGAPEVGDPAVSREPQSLKDHLRLTEKEAAVIADGLRLPEPYRSMLTTAAALHDTGKARDLWQNAMRAPRLGRPYAKTRGGGDGKALGGYRHEFGALRDQSSDAGLDHLPQDLAREIEAARRRLWELPEAARELALHLTAAHHGHARPVITPIDPAAPPSDPAVLALAREAVLRFAKLQRQWGAWGLAWWESLLRAADWGASSKVIEEAEGVGAPSPPAQAAE